MILNIAQIWYLNDAITRLSIVVGLYNYEF